MSASIRAGLMAAGLAAALCAQAQPGPGGAGPMGGPGPRWGADVTPGWQLMTPEERAAHQKAMAEARTKSECTALRERHHDDMAARAQQKGTTLPAQPRRDVCAGLP